MKPNARYLDRIQHFKGNPSEICFAIGRALGARLEQTINHCNAGREYASDMTKLRQGALPWLRRLPKRFRDEMEGMAKGANLPLQRLAGWSYIEECESERCSAAVGLFDRRAWIARNNNSYVPRVISAPCLVQDTPSTPRKHEPPAPQSS